MPRTVWPGRRRSIHVSRVFRPFPRFRPETRMPRCALSYMLPHSAYACLTPIPAAPAAPP
eukprot:4655217-Lingulodinium_polyedra.AAC.1